MLSMFRLTRRLSVRTWYHNVVHVSAFSTLVPKQAISTSTAAVAAAAVAGSSKAAKATKTIASKSRTSDQSIEISISASVENKSLDMRSPPRNSKKFLWTEEKDEVLREGIAKHRKDGWAKVADFLGGGATYHQCFRRARFLEGLAKEGVKRGAWDQEEVCRLKELVPQHLVRSYWSTQYKKMTEEYTDWEGVGKEMGRLPLHCVYKWKNLQCERLKKGRFTTEEDSLLRRRVSEWEGEGSGLWTALQKEMGRSAESIKARWNKLTSEFQCADTVMYWTNEIDERLKEGVAKHKVEGWAKVAEYVGDGVTAFQCKYRWNTYHGAMQYGNVKRGPWDQEEAMKLAELVPQCVVPAYRSKYTGRMTEEHIDWTKVAAKLGRLPVDCKLQWTALRYSNMKTGPFTDSENATIRERVERWGDKGKGLWAGLQRDLGRPQVRIRQQWINVLSRE